MRGDVVAAQFFLRFDNKQHTSTRTASRRQLVSVSRLFRSPGRFSFDDRCLTRFNLQPFGHALAAGSVGWLDPQIVITRWNHHIRAEGRRGLNSLPLVAKLAVPTGASSTRLAAGKPFRSRAPAPDTPRA